MQSIQNHDIGDIKNIGVLVVDDVRDNRDLVEALLVANGFEYIIPAENGQQALNKLETCHNIGVVLLDLMMPEINGYEVCKRITENPLTQHIPVIMVTGAGSVLQDHALFKAFSVGAQDFIAKPLREAELLSRLRGALHLYRERVLRQKNLREINESEKRIRAIINQAPIGIAHINNKGQFLIANDHLSAILGCSYSELLNSNIRNFICDQACISNMETLLSGDNNGFVLETQLRTMQDNPIWVNLSASLVHYNNEVVNTFTFIVEDITERKKITDRMISHMTSYDSLTQLPNRRLFNTELVRALRRAKNGNFQMAVLFLDLDNFKHINDSLGHMMGDRILQNVAQRMRHSLRREDLLARFGGDEFTLLLSMVDNVESVCNIAKKILDDLEPPITIDNRDFYVGASIGISIYPQDGIDIETLIKNADTAMYRAKQVGRRNFQLFNPTLDEHTQRRMELDQELQSALKNNELELHYQPQMDLITGRIIGVEALLRWNHSKRGLLGPAMFLPLAEESGLIIAIGDWVLHEACKQAKKWCDSGHNDIVVFVNLSRRQFQQAPLLLSNIKSYLQDNHIPPGMLGIEVTESINSLDTNLVIESLKAFHKLGIKTSIDDFGIGYSSLNNLKHFQLDSIKIDKSFVHEAQTDAKDQAIINTIIGLSKSFGLQVVAEGIEDSEMLNYVRQQQCDVAQGYFISKPQSAEKIDELLKTDMSFLWSQEEK